MPYHQSESVREMAKKKTIAPEKKERNRKQAKMRRRTNVLICLAIVTTICAAVFIIRVVRHEAALAESVRELAALPALPRTPSLVWSTVDFYDREMRVINPDYVGLLRIEGTTISYPVVRGNDNVKYLTTSFGGAENSFGGLFMDYRCAGENIPHIIIYGHHARDAHGKSHFFGGLDGFLDEEYRTQHPVIIFIENDHISEFEIFSARVTDTDDPAYHLNFNATEAFSAFLERNGAPPDADQILTLSTCYGAGDDDRRIVVQGARRSIMPITENQMMIATYK